MKWGADLSFGQQYVAVISFDYDSQTAKLWVDPADMSSSFIETTFVEEDNKGVDISAVAMRQDYVSGKANNSIAVDWIVVSDDFSMAIPEPASLALLGLGGLVMLRRRK